MKKNEKQENWENFERESISLFELKKFDELFNVCNKALEFNTLNTNAWSMKALYFQEKNQFKEAIACNKKVLEIEPKNSEALVNIGALLGAQKLYKETISFFDKALELKPEEVPVLEMEGNCYLSLKNYKAALECFEKALRLDRKDPDLFVIKGKILGALGLFEAAIVCFEEGLKLTPTKLELLAEKTKIEKKLTQLEATMASCQNLLFPAPVPKEKKGNLRGKEEAEEVYFNAKPHPAVFPYLVMRLMEGGYNLEVMPKAEERNMLAAAVRQELAAEVKTCLVLTPTRAIFIENGKCTTSERIPWGGKFDTDGIGLTKEIEALAATDPSYAARVKILRQGTRPNKEKILGADHLSELYN